MHFEVGIDQRRYWSAATRGWTIDVTTLDVRVGRDSTADLHGAFAVADSQTHAWT